MKTASAIACILLALMLLIFGLNGFLRFIKLPPPIAAAAQFMGALFVSHELVVIMALQVIAGALLLVNRFCASGVGAACAGNHEYSAVPCIHGAKWTAWGSSRLDPRVADSMERSRRLH